MAILFFKTMPNMESHTIHSKAKKLDIPCKYKIFSYNTEGVREKISTHFGNSGGSRSVLGSKPILALGNIFAKKYPQRICTE